MRTSFSFEIFGADKNDPLEIGRTIIAEKTTKCFADIVIGKRPTQYFVAEVVGFDIKYKYKREFLRGKKDYAGANGPCTRGVTMNYILESGKIYDVKHKVSWRSEKRYFLQVDNCGRKHEIGESEVAKCLNAALG